MAGEVTVAPLRLAGALGRVVGVGSSAGGIAALQGLLRGLPTDESYAYVVAQHMSPDQDSHLVELLARETGLRVVFAADGMVLRPGLVVVAQSNCDVRVVEDRVRVVSPGESEGPSPSIDALFRSLAESWGPRAVAIILSGTGTDGTAGAQAVAAAGGLVIAETPAVSGFSGMPQAAIDSGAVSLVRDPQAIGAALGGAGERPMGPGGPDGPADAVDGVVAALRTASGIDFSGYKRPTIERQIARRQAIVGIEVVGDYLREVVADPREAQALTQALLVGVTSFFRDPDSWSALTEVLTGRHAHRADAPLRVWVPGCATGEEAYTAAMICAEVLGTEQPGERLKVFATDLNEASLNAARRGVYSNESVAAIPQEYRDRWLSGVEGGWRVARQLRDCLVFARHNVAFDPPFPTLDLISLRNTMIYLQPHLRDRVLRLCHFSLVPGGLLMLGDSERLEPGDRYFAGLDSDPHIFVRRQGGQAEMLPEVALPPVGAVPSAPAASASSQTKNAMHAALIRVFAPPAIVVDADDAVIEVIGDVSQWCEFPDGQFSSHITRLLRPGPRPVVLALLVQLRRGGHAVANAELAPAGATPVHVQARLLHGARDGLAVVSFTPVREIPAGVGEGVTPITTLGQSGLVDQLTSAQYALEVTVADLGEANDELQLLNEELQASSEELQAANEELAATNEELSTMNAELGIRADLLGQANTDLQNIQSSLTSGMILLDRDLLVIRYTPLAVRLFSLIESDIGRPITAVPTSLRVPDLPAVLAGAIDGSASRITEVHGPDSDFLLAAQPYIAAEGVTIGAVLVITDITELSASRRENARTLAALEAVTNALVETVWRREPDGRLSMLNDRVTDMFGLDRSEVLADPGLLLAAVHPDDRARVAAATTTTPSSGDLTYRVVRPDGSVRWLSQRSQALPASEAGPAPVVSTAVDITDRMALADQAHDRDTVLNAAFDNRLVGVLLLDAQGRILQANDAFADLLGYTPEHLVGTPLSLLVTGSPAADHPDLDRPAAGSVEEVDQRILTAADGSPRHVSIDARPITGLAQSSAAATLVVVHDNTTNRSLRHSLSEQVQYDPQTGAMTRTFFGQHVGQELAWAKHREGILAVLWVDIDDFKAVNDQYGHSVGDIVLRESALRLRSVTRTGDHVGRLGGDEFAILIKDIDALINLELAVDRILAALAEPIKVQDTLIYLTGSVGVAISPEDGADAEHLLRNADTAMYAAKRAGGNQRAYYRMEMNAAAEERATLRQQLAVAVRQEQFEMFYQPIVTTTTGQVTAVEALLRWHRDDEYLAAEQFLAAALETGQMRAIGLMVLAMVDTDITRLAAAGIPDLPISINFSPDELEDRNLVDALLAWTPTGGFTRLIIEVTETSALVLHGKATEALRLMQRLGAHLAIDDFGTGYSNLENLERMRPAVVKIDRSLLTNAETGTRGAQVLAASVQLAHALDARVIIEGVETTQQHDTATALGAEEVQGHFIAHPMPLEHLITWLSTHHTAAATQS